MVGKARIPTLCPALRKGATRKTHSRDPSVPAACSINEKYSALLLAARGAAH